MTPKREIGQQQYIANYPSRERVKGMGRMLAEAGGSLPDDFDIDEISWVTPRIGITDFEGSIEAVAKGYQILNVAGELESICPGVDTIAIEPYHGKVKETLDEIADLINVFLSRDKNFDIPPTKVVVNCAMGIERSPLAVAWYLHTYSGFPWSEAPDDLTLDEAYDIVRQARPVAVERRYWIEGYDDTEDYSR